MNNPLAPYGPYIPSGFESIKPSDEGVDYDKMENMIDAKMENSVFI